MLVHEGIEFMYILAGSLVYRVADRTYDMSPGDSLCFDAGSPHGPEKLVNTPIKLLAVIGTARM
jgi:mannose-6-phosphate isomerase-like protein (cupin superfamily)